MASSTLFRILLSLLFFGLASLCSNATYPNNNQVKQTPTAYLPKILEEKLTKELNLFPKYSISTASIDTSVSAPKLVEKQFTFSPLRDPGPSVQEFGRHAGYYKLPHSKSAWMFYFFFESRSCKSDPVVIWLTGGPGCSSELALFYENGPVHIANDLSLVWNDYGWDKASNLIFVDQPIGTGFSYTSDKDDIRHDEEGVSNDLYDFLQAFFAEHPEYAKNDFYITGESYAGHCIPAFASRVHKKNKAKQGIHINLKGFAIGNGLTDPAIQYKAYPEYALSMRLIKQSDYESINDELIPKCEQAIKTCESDGGQACSFSFYFCERIFREIMGIAGQVNHYDIRKKCVGKYCYDLSNMEKFLNETFVRDALGVRDMRFDKCNRTVRGAMQMNLEVGIPALLEDGVRVLVYAGSMILFATGLEILCGFMPWNGPAEKILQQLPLFCLKSMVLKPGK